MKNTQSRFKLAKIAGVMTAVAISGGAFADVVSYTEYVSGSTFTHSSSWTDSAVAAGNYYYDTIDPVTGLSAGVTLQQNVVTSATYQVTFTQSRSEWVVQGLTQAQEQAILLQNNSQNAGGYFVSDKAGHSDNIARVYSADASVTIWSPTVLTSFSQIAVGNWYWISSGNSSLPTYQQLTQAQYNTFFAAGAFGDYFKPLQVNATAPMLVPGVSQVSFQGNTYFVNASGQLLKADGTPANIGYSVVNGAVRSDIGQATKAVSQANPTIVEQYTAPDGKTHAYFNGTYYATVAAAQAAQTAFVASLPSRTSVTSANHVTTTTVATATGVNADGTIAYTLSSSYVADAGFHLDANNMAVANSVTLAAKSVAYRGRVINVPSMTGDNQAAAQALQDQYLAAQQAGIDNHVTNLTNEAVAGAIVTNIIADELINPALKEYGVSVGATVSGSGDFPEEHIGVNKDLSQETGIDGLSANIGAGIVSGNISAGINKSFEINENIRVNVGVSISENGISYLPGAMVHQKTEFAGDVGVGFAGPLPVVMVGGYQVTVVPQLFLPNLCVVAAKIVYNFIKGEIKSAESTAVNSVSYRNPAAKPMTAQQRLGK